MDKQPKVAIILPTRGMVFTEVEEYIENVRRTYQNITVHRSHNLPIPDCLNVLVEQALQDPEVDYVWFIEEDTVPPDRTLDRFFEATREYDCASVDYGFNGGHNTIVRSSVDNRILFSGFGCTFVKRSVFDKLERPLFRADRAFNISAMQWYPVQTDKVYGMHDIDFFWRLREKGITITQVEGECRHLQLVSLGAKEINDGRHVIGEKDRIGHLLTLPL